MKKNYSHSILTFLLTLFFSVQLSAQVNVTFKVDMSSETVSADGVHIVGSLNNWTTDATPLTKEGDTDVYSATIQLNSGWQEYKFLNGNAWGTDESAGYPCAASNGNRFVYINDSTNDVILVAVPFNGCNAENTGFSLNLNVDMSSETVSADGVRLAGWFNGWSGDNLSVPDVDGDIYSATLRLPTPSDYPIVLEYKFINGSDWETPLATCGTVANDNRIETVATSGQNIYNVFNGCNYTLSLNDSFLSDIQTFYKKNEGIVINSLENHSKLTIELFDLLGKKIFSQTFTRFNTRSKTIKLNKTDIGVHILKITNDSNKIFTKKILID
jgi:hypothetical protein